MPGGDFRERHVRCGRLVDWGEFVDHLDGGVFGRRVLSVGSFDLEGAVFGDAEVDVVRDQVALGGGFLGHGVFAGGER